MSGRHSFILSALAIMGDGSGVPLNDDEVAKALSESGLAWVHVDRGHKDCNAWIQKTLDYLPEISRRALLAEETRPRVEEYGEGILINLRAANLNPGAEAHDMISLRLWVDEARIVSLQRRRIRAIEDVVKKLEAGGGPRDAGGFIAALCYQLVRRMEPVVTELDEEMDDLEERVIDGPSPALRKDIIEIRRQAIAFRRFMAPQREAVARLRALDKSWITPAHRLLLQETYDHLLRFIEDLDAIRERSQIIQDELQNALSDQLNKRLYLLAIVTAIFLPLSFLTGLLGINVAGIPGAEHPWAFLIFVGILAVIIVFQMIYFKRRGWF